MVVDALSIGDEMRLGFQAKIPQVMGWCAVWGACLVSSGLAACGKRGEQFQIDMEALEPGYSFIGVRDEPERPVGGHYREDPGINVDGASHDNQRLIPVEIELWWRLKSEAHLPTDNSEIGKVLGFVVPVTSTGPVHKHRFAIREKIPKRVLDLINSWAYRVDMQLYFVHDRLQVNWQLGENPEITGSKRYLGQRWICKGGDGFDASGYQGAKPQYPPLWLVDPAIPIWPNCQLP
jgi:hypothetical protein